MRRIPLGLTLMMALTLIAGSAFAQINPWRGSKAGEFLSADDLDALLASVNQLNRSANVAVGAAEPWRNPRSGSQGVSTITGLTQHGGMNCHVIRHQFSVRKSTTPSQYDLTWCLTPAGEWKILN